MRVLRLSVNSFPPPHVSNVKHRKSMSSAGVLSSMSHNPTQCIRLWIVTS